MGKIWWDINGRKSWHSSGRSHETDKSETAKRLPVYFPSSPPWRGRWKWLLLLRFPSVVLNCRIIDMWWGHLMLTSDLNKDETQRRSCEMTVHRCVTPTLLARGTCEWKERLCFTLHCKCRLENCFTYCTRYCTLHIINGILKSLANLLHLWAAKREFVIIANNYLRKSYRLSAKEAGLRFLHPVLSQSLPHCTSRCPPDPGEGLRPDPRGII